MTRSDLRAVDAQPSDVAAIRTIAPAAAPAARGRAGDEAALEKSAEALEGLFNSMLDRTIAQDVARRQNGERDLSVSPCEALRDRLGPPADTAQ